MQTVTLTIQEAGGNDLLVEIDAGREWPRRTDGMVDGDALTRCEVAALYAAQCIGEAGSGPIRVTVL